MNSIYRYDINDLYFTCAFLFFCVPGVASRLCEETHAWGMKEREQEQRVGNRDCGVSDVSKYDVLVMHSKCIWLCGMWKWVYVCFPTCWTFLQCSWPPSWFKHQDQCQCWSKSSFRIDYGGSQMPSDSKSINITCKRKKIRILFLRVGSCSLPRSNSLTFSASLNSIF